MIEGVTHIHLGPIWYHSEPSDVPYCPNQFLGWDFFYRFLQQTGSSSVILLRVHLFAANPMVFRNRLVRLYSVLCGIPQIIEGIPFSYHFPMVHYYYSN